VVVVGVEVVVPTSFAAVGCHEVEELEEAATAVGTTGSAYNLTGWNRSNEARAIICMGVPETATYKAVGAAATVAMTQVETIIAGGNMTSYEPGPADDPIIFPPNVNQLRSDVLQLQYACETAGVSTTPTATPS
jgi:hypothetical protein